MDISDISDDFITIGKCPLLLKMTGNRDYDFDFRHFFECRSVLSQAEEPVLLRIGAIADYAGTARLMERMGMKLLVSEAEHNRCSLIDNWYPAIKAHSPFTIVYDQLPALEELMAHFSFPVFIKGHRQTNRHKKSQCIIEDAEMYERLRREWTADEVLHWQKAAVREYVPLQIIDAASYPDMVPQCYEFRFFYWEGKCMGYGPYWTMGCRYSLADEDVEPALQLADWTANRISTTFVAIDIAKTANGEWIVIEVNDAQESGLAGVNPLSLWKNITDAAQERTWIPVENLLPEGAVIVCGDPTNGVSIADMREIIEGIESEGQLATVYATVCNKFWLVDDNTYDYEVGTAEYIEACAICEAWGAMMDELEARILVSIMAEMDSGSESMPVSADIKTLTPFMDRNGYRNGAGWWVPKD